METETNAVVEGAEQDVVTQQPDNDQATAEESTDSFSTVDINSLPEELKPLAKQLQGDYTRKTQELSATRGKAQAFDELVNNPGFATMMENIEKYGSPVAPPKEPEAKISGVELLEKMIEDPDYFWQEVERRAEEKVKPHVEYLSEREASQVADTEIARLTTLYPDFPDYADKIATRIEDSKFALTAEQAYMLETYSIAKSSGMDEGAKATEKRMKNAGNTSNTGVVAPEKQFSTMQEAFAAALKQHGG